MMVLISYLMIPIEWVPYPQKECGYCRMIPFLCCFWTIWEGVEYLFSLGICVFGIQKNTLYCIKEIDYKKK